MIESLTSKGTELTSSKSEFGKGFNPDSPAEISTKGSDVHAPFPRENKEPEFDPRFNPDERISIGDKIPMDGEGDKWERHESVEYENCIDSENLFARFDDSVKLGFRNTIKDAKRFIESCLEDKLINGTTTPIGLIFALKNNYGWVDKQEVEQTTKTINVDLED